jgi:hypothetical protein
VIKNDQERVCEKAALAAASGFSAGERLDEK